MEVVKGKEEVAEGILSLDVHHPEHQGIVFVAVYFMFLLWILVMLKWTYFPDNRKNSEIRKYEILISLI